MMRHHYELSRLCFLLGRADKAVLIDAEWMVRPKGLDEKKTERI